MAKSERMIVFRKKNEVCMVLIGYRTAEYEADLAYYKSKSAILSLEIKIKKV